jgi:hypothetical protein
LKRTIPSQFGPILHFRKPIQQVNRGSLWPWSYGRWIYNYQCNQCLSPLTLWVRNSIRARCTILCDKVYQGLATGLWFSLVSSTNKTDRHYITEILLKVALSTIKQTKQWERHAPFPYLHSYYVLSTDSREKTPILVLLALAALHVIYLFTLYVCGFYEIKWKK